MSIHRQFELELGRRVGLFALEVGHRLADHAQVEIETDARNVPRLLSPEQVASTANLEVFQRHLHAGTKFIVRGNCREAVVRQVGQRLARVIEEVRVGTFTAATNATSNLVQLAQAKALGAIDNQGVGVWNIDSGLDDRGRNQHIEALFPEVNHHLLECRLTHLPVSNGDARFGH